MQTDPAPHAARQVVGKPERVMLSGAPRPSYDALAAEVERLREILARADEAWCGLTQTTLAASAVGIDLARSVTNEGYGLHLKIAMRDAREAALIKVSSASPEL